MKIAHALLLACLAMALVAADCRADDCGSWQEKGLSPDQAIETCTRSIKSGKWTGGDQATNYNNRGNVWYYKGQYDKAISDYDKAIELNPGYATAYYNRGSVWYAKGKHDEAIAEFGKAIELNPNYAKAYVWRGVVRKAKGQHDEAISDYSKAIQLEPGGAAAYYNRSNEYEAKGQFGMAVADMEKYVKLAPKDLGGQKRLKELQAKAK